MTQHAYTTRNPAAVAAYTAVCIEAEATGKRVAPLGCDPALQLRLDRAAEHLTCEGLPVRVRLDERNWACIRFLCACSTRDEVRGLSAILAITPNVRREVR